MTWAGDWGGGTWGEGGWWAGEGIGVEGRTGAGDLSGLLCPGVLGPAAGEGGGKEGAGERIEAWDWTDPGAELVAGDGCGAGGGAESKVLPEEPLKSPAPLSGMPNRLPPLPLEPPWLFVPLPKMSLQCSSGPRRAAAAAAAADWSSPGPADEDWKEPCPSSGKWGESNCGGEKRRTQQMQFSHDIQF